MATYEQVVVADAPLVYFHLDSTSGTTETNLGTAGGAGTITGTGFTRGQTSVGTVPGTSFKLPNATTASYVTSGNITLTDYTFEVWFRKDTAFAGTSTIKLLSLVGTTGAELTIGRNNGYFRVADGGLNDGPIIAGIVDGSWNHLVVTKSGGSVTWYRNGVSVYTGSSSSVVRTNYTARVAGTANSDHSPAWIDEPAFYNRALDAAEVLEHYNTAFAAQVVNVSVASPVTTSTVTAVDALNKQVGVTSTAATSSVNAVDAGVTAVDIWHNTATSTDDDDFVNIGNSNATTLQIQGTGATGTARTLFYKFPDPRQANTVIESLKFRFTVSNVSTPITVRLDRLTTNWSESVGPTPSKVATSVTKTISTPGVHEFVVTGTDLNAWNTGAGFYGVALTATSTTGAVDIRTRDHSDLAARPVMESQLMTNAMNINVTAPVVTSDAVAKDATVVATVSRINAAPAVTSSITAVAGTALAQRNVDVTAPVVSSDVVARNANVVVINPDVTNAAPVVTSSVIAKDANVVAGISVEVDAGIALATSTAVNGSFTNVTTVNVLAPTAVTNSRAISTYDRTQDRYVAYVPFTVDADDIWYQMEEQSGTVAFDAVSEGTPTNTPGTYVGTPEFGIEGPQFRKAVHFSGDDYLVMNYFQSQFSIADYTIEFSIRTSQQNGVLFSNGGKTSVALVNGEMIMGDRTSQFTSRVRKNIADGQWHHIVISYPQATVQSPIRPFFVMIDGSVEYRRNDGALGIPNIPTTAMALYNKSAPATPATEHLTGDMRDLIVRLNYAISIDTALKLYYEWSNSVIITTTPATTNSVAKAGKGRGNVKKMLAIYGLPYSLDTFYTELMNYKSVFAGFYIDTKTIYSSYRQLDNGANGWAPVVPFYLNDYLVYPVSITGREPSAAGVGSGEYIDPIVQKYIDDKTGSMRFIDLDRDLIGPVTEYDALTVVNYPAFAPSDDVRRGDLNQKSYGLSGSEWSKIRNDLADSILSAAARGVNIWAPEPQMLESLGVIQGYDVHPTGNWQGGMTPNNTTPNLAAANIDNAHLTSAGKVDLGTVGQTLDYSATFQVNYFRRVVGLEEGLTDIPAYIRGDSLYQYRYDRFHGYADMSVYDVVDRTNGLQVGDRVAMSIRDLMNTAGGTGDLDPIGVIEARQGGRKSIVSARPDGIVGKVITREMEWYYGPSGSIVQNPYKNNAITIAVERGTLVKGVVIKGRIFGELMDSSTTATGIAIDRYQDMWNGVRGRNVTTWSYDNRRNGPFNGNVTGGSWVPITDALPTITMNGRGLKWLASASDIPEGDVRIYGPVATSDVEAEAATITKIRNVSVSAKAATSKVEARDPYDPNRPDAVILADVATSEIIVNGTGVVIKAPPVTSEVVANTASIDADKERIYVTITGSRNVTLFMKED